MKAAFSFASLLLLVAPLASALNITYPNTDVHWARGSQHTIKWTSVDTDPKDFSIYLVNFVDFPPQNIKLASNVPSNAGSYNIQIPSNVNASSGYQINFDMGDNVYVIYAQSPDFTITSEVVSNISTSTATSYTNKTTLLGEYTTTISVAKATAAPTVWIRVPVVETVTETKSIDNCAAVQAESTSMAEVVAASSCNSCSARTIVSTSVYEVADPATSSAVASQTVSSSPIPNANNGTIPVGRASNSSSTSSTIGEWSNAGSQVHFNAKAMVSLLVGVAGFMMLL